MIGTGVHVSFAPDRTRYGGEGGGLKEDNFCLHRKPYCLLSHVPHAKGSKGQTAISLTHNPSPSAKGEGSKVSLVQSIWTADAELHKYGTHPHTTTPRPLSGLQVYTMPICRSFPLTPKDRWLPLWAGVSGGCVDCPTPKAGPPSCESGCVWPLRGVE